MTVQLLALLLCVILLLPAVVGPRVLRSAAPLLMRLPRLTIGLLTGSVVVWVLAALSVGPMLAWLVTGPDVLPDNAAAVCTRCLAAADPFGLERVDTVIPVVVLLAVPVAVSVAYAASIVVELRRRHHTMSGTAARFRRESTPARLHGHAVRLVDEPHPFALTMPRRHGGIVVSTGAVELLTEQELRAVLAHEHAHLQQRHHLVKAIVSTLSARLRWVPLVAAVEAALGHYLEIAADDAARRQAGTPALASALLTLGEHGRPGASGDGLVGALHALGPDRIRHLVQPDRGTAGVAATVASAFCLTSLALLAAVVHVPYALAVVTGCF